jgi:hypothetical protein
LDVGRDIRLGQRGQLRVARDIGSDGGRRKRLLKIGSMGKLWSR